MSGNTGALISPSRPAAKSPAWKSILWIVLAPFLLVDVAWAQTWSLSGEQRKEYLNYYSPIIFKRANENESGHEGFDWITNFNFDRDGVFSNNKVNWGAINEFVMTSIDPFFSDSHDWDTWRIRPTLYSAIIEFMQDGQKSVILLYHVYHAKQQGSIHDWERVELRVDGVSGIPGSGTEQVNYAVITEHSKHNARVLGEVDLNFMETSFGKHVMLWQAEWSNDPFGFDLHELHWVEDTFAGIDVGNQFAMSAKVNVNGDKDRRSVNYVFVCDCDPEAVAYWNAQTITHDNALDMVAGPNNHVRWDEIRRATFELQDLADILPTHWEGNSYSLHWTSPSRMIKLESPILSEDGTELVPTGLQRFFFRSIDSQDAGESRGGYPDKHWFWGAYLWGQVGNFVFDAYEFGDPFGERGLASGHLDSHGNYWWQHDYFAHVGVHGDGSADGEQGEWLFGAWYTEAEGGFDGRWVQRFPNSREPVRNDLNADRMSDVLWRNTATGNNVLWQMNGFTKLAGSIGVVGAEWKVEGLGDFDGDRRSDILWRNASTSNPVIWFMDGFTRLSDGPIDAPVADWQVVGLGDFNGNGKSDILWRDTITGNTVIWQMNGLTRKYDGSIGSPEADWQVASVDDFDGDGKSDILWRNTSSGSAVIWLMDGFTKLAGGSIGGASLDWQVVGTGDFDGDDRADILWRNLTTGATVIWKMDGLSKTASGGIGGVPLVWEVAGVGDFDADAKADILWRNTTTGAAVVWLMDGFSKLATGGIGGASLDWQVQ